MADLKLNRLTSNVYWSSPDSTTDRPVLGAVVGERGTLIIDAGNSVAHARLFQEALNREKVTAPTYLGLTHWHWDHVFGTAAWPLPSFASAETAARVREMAGLDWSDEALDRRVAEGTEIEFCRDMLKLELPDPSQRQLIPPDIAFKERVELHLGGLRCQLDHVGGDHAGDSTIVYVPEARVLFLGDCLYPNLYHPAPCYTTEKLFPLIEQLVSYEADFYLESHNPEPVPRAELLAYTNQLKHIGQTVGRLGPDRAAILAELEAAGPLAEDDPELVDYFLAGESARLKPSR